MVTVPKGVAHVSFRGGGCFLPVRTPYGRELLVEYVADLVRTNGLVQVLIDDRRWLVQGSGDRPAASCAGCGRGLKTRCECDGAAPSCMGCAFRNVCELREADAPVERRYAS